MDSPDLRRRLADSTVAVLSTVGAGGRPHSVPICFAFDGDFIYFAVDHKPKRTTELRRLHNIAANPLVAVLVQHYEHDWDRLWWVRADGTAAVLADGDASRRAVALLVDRYEQYRAQPPAGPVVAIHIERISGWSST
jgi:PPOX class probable F420-dependent enzyme